MTDTTTVSKEIATASAAVVVAVFDLTTLPWPSIGIAVLMACVGGSVHGLRHLDSGNARTISFVRDICYGGFAGLVAVLVAGYYGLDAWASLAIAAISGWLGKTILDWAGARLMSWRGPK